MNLSVKDVSALEEVSERQIQRYVSEGYKGHKLPATRTGKRLTIDSDDYRAWRALCGWETAQPAGPLRPVASQIAAQLVPGDTVVRPQENAIAVDLSPDLPAGDPVVPAKWPPYPQPANPRGGLTNCPHPNSSNWPHPGACQEYLENAAREQERRLRGVAPDEN